MFTSKRSRPQPQHVTVISCEQAHYELMLIGGKWPSFSPPVMLPLPFPEIVMRRWQNLCHATVNLAPPAQHHRGSFTFTIKMIRHVRAFGMIR
jgi:hypothetical protein